MLDMPTKTTYAVFEVCVCVCVCDPQDAGAYQCVCVFVC